MSTQRNAKSVNPAKTSKRKRPSCGNDSPKQSVERKCKKIKSCPDKVTSSLGIKRSTSTQAKKPKNVTPKSSKGDCAKAKKPTTKSAPEVNHKNNADTGNNKDTIHHEQIRPKFDLYDSSANFLVDFLLPLLEDGKDLALLQWMADFNLLKQPDKCAQENCDSRTFNLVVMNRTKSAYGVWKCADSTCKRTMPIRQRSFFKNLSCTIHHALYCIIAWCEKKPPDVVRMERGKGIKDEVVRQIFRQCFETVHRYINKNLPAGLIGGPGSVALIDVWPNFASSNPNPRNSKLSYSERVNLLLLADTNCVPVKYWVHLLPSFQPLQKLLTDEDKRNLEEYVESQIYSFVSGIDVEEVKKTRSPDSREKRFTRRGILREQQEMEDDDKMEKEFKSSKPINKHEISNRKKTSKEHKVDTEENVQEDHSEKYYKRINDARRHIMFQASKQMEALCRQRELTDSVLSAVEILIAPGSLVLVNDNTLPNAVNALRKTGKYEGVASVQDILSAKDEGHASTTSILDNIWQTATFTCSNLESCTRHQVNCILNELHWRQIYGVTNSSAVYNLLSHISTDFVPPSKSGGTSAHIETEN